MTGDAAPRAFISYARDDGEEFKNALRKRLAAEAPEITLWIDRDQMKGGRDWWAQITDALDRVKFMVIVMTPAVLTSETTRREWRYARQQGVCVCPVKGVPDGQLDYAALPTWMSGAHFYDLEREWETFLAFLCAPCQRERVPFMAPAPPDRAVARPREFDQALATMIDPGTESAVAVTTALEGIGGFGKTTLAQMICHDDRVIDAYTGGILWVTIGQDPDLIACLRTLYAGLTGERPDFATLDDAAAGLAERLDRRRALIVVDDVWNHAHLEPFSRRGDNCTRLLTTRKASVAECASRDARIEVDVMTEDESIQLLLGQIERSQVDYVRARNLCGDLGKWPLLLQLVRAQLARRVDRGESPALALDALEERYHRQGVRAFDQRDPVARAQAVGLTVDASLDELPAFERAWLTELGVFARGFAVPIGVVGDLWGVNDSYVEEVLADFDERHLVRLDLSARSVSLHDVLRGHFLDVLGLGRARACHAQLLDAWDSLTEIDGNYRWRHVGFHLASANRLDALRALLVDPAWLARKLDAVGVAALVADFDYLAPDDEVPMLIGRTLRLVQHHLVAYPDQLARQLFARLTFFRHPELQHVREVCGALVPTSLEPRAPSLATAAGRLLQVLAGHPVRVIALAVTSDAQRIVSGGADGDIRVWDVASGEPIGEPLSVGRGGVGAIAITPDGQRIVSGDADGDIRFWDGTSGAAVGDPLPLHERVNAIAITPDGQRIISGDPAGAIRVWDAASGGEIKGERRLGHRRWVGAIAITPDGQRIVSGGGDGDIRVWDLADGGPVGDPLPVHEPVYAIAITPDGQRIISAGQAGDIRVWDVATAEEIRDEALAGDSGWVTALAITPDGRQIISGGADGQIRVWDARSDSDNREALARHSGKVGAIAITPDGQRIVSGGADGDIRVWDGTSGAPLGEPLVCHRRGINAIAVTRDGQRIITGGFGVFGEGDIRIWDPDTGAPLGAPLAGHRKGGIRAMAVSPDGQWIVGGDRYGTMRIWDAGTGATIGEPLSDHGDAIRAIAITPDGRRIVSCTGSVLARDGDIRIWNSSNGVAIGGPLVGHIGRVNALAITPDGHRIISGGADGQIRVWDVTSGASVGEPLAGPEPVVALAISADGQRIVSGGGVALRIWDFASRSLLLEFAVDRPVTTLAWAGAAHFAFGDIAGRVHVFSVHHRVESQ